MRERRLDAGDRSRRRRVVAAENDREVARPQGVRHQVARVAQHPMQLVDVLGMAMPVSGALRPVRGLHAQAVPAQHTILGAHERGLFLKRGVSQ